MKGLSKITDGLIGQPMFNLLARIKEMERSGKRVIHFEIGDPDFGTPDYVIERTKKSSSPFISSLSSSISWTKFSSSPSGLSVKSSCF